MPEKLGSGEQHGTTPSPRHFPACHSTSCSPQTLYQTRSVNTDDHALETEVLVGKAFPRRPCGSGRTGRVIPCRLAAWPHLFTAAFPKTRVRAAASC